MKQNAINFRLTDKERKDIEEAAKSYGISMTQFIKFAIEKAIEEKPMFKIEYRWKVEKRDDTAIR